MKQWLEDKIREQVKPLVSDHGKSRPRHILSHEGLIYLLKNYKFNTVLDIGSGEGVHANYLRLAGKKVDTVDFGNSIYSENTNDEITFIGDFLKIDFNKKYQCIFCSHVLEHSLNVNIFLKKCNDLLLENGKLLITVPPVRTRLVGGHVNQFTKASLILHLILAGFDCTDIRYTEYGYNQTFILEKKYIDINKLKIIMDSDDLLTLKNYFPAGLKEELKATGYKAIRNIPKELNW